MTALQQIGRKYPIEIRLMLHTETRGECIVWTGQVDADGYGRARVDGRQQRLNRVVWEIANGKPIPDGLVVRHRCDNPPCVNPAHLILGTPKQNGEDAASRSRMSQGEAHHAHRLMVSDVREIRRRLRAGESVTVLAREFGVRPWSIQKIRDGVTWKHVA